MLNNLKILLTDLLHLSRDALHIHVGLGIYIIAILALRRGPASPVPWLIVLGFELINEVLDLYHEVDFSGSIVDVLNTMLWPTIALAIARYVAHRSQQREGTKPRQVPERPNWTKIS
ncbi:hypothetical protein [Devosia sp.]|uniref:hypothetical protein n=1 Tax=Devosia sp. TaxID=1871048 RepID=UPI003267CB7C